jgi:hypothetical protein
MNPENRAMLPPALFHTFTKRFEEPTVSEGFQDITKIDFVVSGNFYMLIDRYPLPLLSPRQLQGTEAELAIWSKYWV